MLKLDRIAVPSPPFWGLLIALLALFFMGGSSRSDVQSLAILNPTMIICCGAAFLSLKREHWAERKWLAGSVGFIFFLGVLYILPFPMNLDGLTSGLGNVADIRATANVSGASHTLAMVPHAALQSFFFLFAPLAVILFALQLTRDDLRYALPLLIILVAVSGVIGLIQLAGGKNGPLYFYDITNNGSAVGLFANRNHAAVLLGCLFPMLAILAARSHVTRNGDRNTRQFIAAAIAIVLIPLILVTGSRSGMLTAIVGLIGGFLLYISNSQTHLRSKTRFPLKPVAAIVIVICLVFATIYFSRAEAIDRAFADNGGVNGRADFWISGMALFTQYFPFGFGPGSFVPVFQADEPIALLRGIYLNKLHNDWLETGLTFGALGMILMLGGVSYYFLRSFQLWFRMDCAHTAVALGRMASIVIAVLAIASLSDYPLRTPAMMGFAALVCLWFVGVVPDRQPRLAND